MKTCTKCKIEKDFSNYIKHPKGKYGLYPSCKECQSNYMNEYVKKRRKTDLIHKDKLSIRSSISRAFKYGNNKIYKVIGCTIEEFKIHIKSKFKDGMTLDNYGEWHFDHIIPLATAQTKEQIIKLCHYTNLQPLWAEENFAKGYKIIP